MKWSHKKTYMLRILSLLLLLVLIPMAVFVVQKQQDTRVRAAGAIPHVQGNQIIDGFGNPLILKGAHIQSLLDRELRSSTLADRLAFQHLNSSTFDVMVNNWHMNTLRLATSDYLWQTWQPNSAAYIQLLQNIVAQAYQSGLYVVLSMHEDVESGLPANLKEPSGWALPTSEAISYWQAMASAFKGNPGVMFDIYNEPHVNETGQTLDESGIQDWLNGTIITSNGKTYPTVGFQTLVDTIRQQGANQIIVVQAPENSFQNFESSCQSIGQGSNCNFIKDTAGNIVYSVHQYFGDNLKPGSPIPDPRTSPAWDLKFGNLGQEVPIFIGEWEFSINSGYTSRCDEPPPNQTTSMTPAEATALVQSFLTYMDGHGTNWTVFGFAFNQLFTGTGKIPQQNAYTLYTPTSLNGTWTCGDIHSNAGDGGVIKGYLLNGDQSFTPTPTP